MLFITLSYNKLTSKLYWENFRVIKWQIKWRIALNFTVGIKHEQTKRKIKQRRKGFQEVEDPRFRENRHMQVVRFVWPRHRPPLRPRRYTWYPFLLRVWVDPRATVRPERLCRWKIPITPSRIYPVTFRLIAHYLSQLRHREAPYKEITNISFIG